MREFSHTTHDRGDVETGDTLTCRYEAYMTIVVSNGISYAGRLVWKKIKQI